MYLTIWRHGEAGSAVTDRMRELTARGQDDVAWGATRYQEYCAARSVPLPEQLLYSEWIRTAQTAAIIAKAFPTMAADSCAALIPGRRPADVERELGRRYPEELPEHVMLVSHQPLVSLLADYYTGEPGRVPGLVPGGFVVLRMDYPGPDAARAVCCAQPPGYEVVL